MANETTEIGQMIRDFENKECGICECGNVHPRFVENMIKAIAAEQKVNQQAVELLRKVRDEWWRQKQLFPELNKDGWMDIEMRHIDTFLAKHSKDTNNSNASNHGRKNE